MIKRTATTNIGRLTAMPAMPSRAFSTAIVDRTRPQAALAPAAAAAQAGRFSANVEGTGGRSSTSGRTVTVFGCTGQLGRLLVNQLGKHGTQVVVPYRGDQEDPRHLKVMGDLGQIVPLRFDVRDKESLMQCVRHSDTVYNLVGRDYETRNFSFDDVHVKAARAIAETCQEAGVERLVHVSAMNADSEEAQARSAWLKTKAAGEKAVREAFPTAIIVRPGTVYGWHDRLISYLGETMTHPVKRYYFGAMLPMVDGGKREFYPVNAADVARGMYRISTAESPASLYEFYGPNKYTYREFVELFCEYARRPFNPISLPYKAYRSWVSLTQLNPLCRMTVHDVDRWSINDQPTPDALRLSDLGVQAESFESVGIQFARHFRSNRWADQPATIAEVKHWEKFTA